MTTRPWVLGKFAVSKNKKSNSDEPLAFKLPSTVNLSNINEVCDELKSRVSESEGLIVDLSDLENATTPLAQLLLSAEKTLGDAGHAVEIVNCPEPVREEFARLGLSEKIEQWSAER